MDRKSRRHRRTFRGGPPKSSQRASPCPRRGRRAGDRSRRHSPAKVDEGSQMTRSRTQRCGESQARQRLARARSFLEVAEIAADESDPSLEYGAAAASIAILAGIAAADAACCQALGCRSRSDSHHDAEQLLADIAPGGKTAGCRAETFPAPGRADHRIDPEGRWKRLKSTLGAADKTLRYDSGYDAE